MDETTLWQRVEQYEAHPTYAGFWELPWPQGENTQYKSWWWKEKLWYIHQSNLERVAGEITSSRSGGSPPPAYKEVRDTYYSQAEGSDMVYLLRQLARGGRNETEEQLRTLLLVVLEDVVNPLMKMVGLPSQGAAIDVIAERTLPFLLQIRGNTAFADMPGWLLYDWCSAMLADVSQVAEEDVEDQDLRFIVADSVMTIPDWAQAFEERGKSRFSQKLHNLTNEEQETLAVSTHDITPQHKAFLLSTYTGRHRSSEDIKKLLKSARNKIV